MRSTTLERLGKLNGQQELIERGVIAPDTKFHVESSFTRSLAFQILREREPFIEVSQASLRAETETRTKRLWSDVSDSINFDSFALRVLADLLGSQRQAANVTLLLPILSKAPPDDIELVHAVRMALRDSLLAPGGFSEATRLATTEAKISERIADVSLGAKTPEAAEFLLGQLGRTKLQGARSGEFLRHAVLYLPPEKIGAIAGLVESVKDAPLPQRLTLADSLAQACRQRGLPLPDGTNEWTHHTMLDALASSNDLLAKRGTDAVREIKLDAKLVPLTQIARDEKRNGALRLAALEAAADLPASRDLFIATLGDPRHMILRKRAAELLAQNGHNDIILAALPNAPDELALSICAALARSDAGAAALLDAIDAGKTSPRFLTNRAVIGPFLSHPSVFQDRAIAIVKNLPPEDARLNAVIAEHTAAYGKAKPDAAHGAQVFLQHCGACHRFRNAGGNVGPNLDGVIARGPARLIEDILDPNRNVDPLFRQTIFETTDGDTLLGANLRDQGDAILFADPTGKEHTILKAKIRKQTASGLSLMPPVFESAIPSADFNDLLGYLLNPP